MISDDMLSQIALGEDSHRQFKQNMINADALAVEMAAFANAEGGTIFLGVADDGSIPGLTYADVSRINQIISNAASQHIKSPLTVKTENIAIEDERVVIVLTIPIGQDKPYFDRNGVIWLKNGADGKLTLGRSSAACFRVWINSMLMNFRQRQGQINSTDSGFETFSKQHMIFPSLIHQPNFWFCSRI